VEWTNVITSRFKCTLRSTEAEIVHSAINDWPKISQKQAQISRTTLCSKKNMTTSSTISWTRTVHLQQFLADLLLRLRPSIDKCFYFLTSQKVRCENKNTRQWRTVLVISVPNSFVNGQFYFNLSSKARSHVFIWNAVGHFTFWISPFTQQNLY